MIYQKVLGSWFDPFGRNILLEARCWRGHILKNHPDMAFRLEEIKLTIEDPDEIRKQGISRLYYRKSLDRFGNNYLKVAVKFAPKPHKGDGFVASAYPIREKEQRGEIEWRNE